MIHHSEKRSLFDAWITDGFSVPTADGTGFEVISLGEMRARLEKLIEDEKFSEIKIMTKKIREPVSFSESKRSKSIRVPLNVYIKIVELALTRKISLNQVILEYIFKKSETTIENFAKRSDINNEKLALIRASRLTLRKEDYFRVSRGGIASIMPPYIPNHYKLKFRKTPAKWESIARQLTDEAIEKYLSEYQEKIPREVLERYIELASHESLFQQNLSEREPFTVMLGDDGKLSSKIEWIGLEFIGDEEYEHDITHEFGYETAKLLRENLGSWVYSDGDSVEDYYTTLYQVDFHLSDDGSLFINGISIDELEDRINSDLSDEYQEKVNKLKEEMTEALHNENYEKIEELSHETTWLRRRYSWTQYFLELLIKLNKGKSQVISFPAPDCIIALWEAYGDTEFSDIFTFE